MLHPPTHGRLGLLSFWGRTIVFCGVGRDVVVVILTGRQSLD